MAEISFGRAAVEASQQFIDLDNDVLIASCMGCFTGDCPHDSSAECVKDLQIVYVAMAREIARLRRLNETYKSALPNEIGRLQ